MMLGSKAAPGMGAYCAAALQPQVSTKDIRFRGETRCAVRGRGHGHGLSRMAPQRVTRDRAAERAGTLSSDVDREGSAACVRPWVPVRERVRHVQA